MRITESAPFVRLLCIDHYYTSLRHIPVAGERWKWLVSPMLEVLAVNSMHEMQPLSDEFIRAFAKAKPQLRVVHLGDVELRHVKSGNVVVSRLFASPRLEWIYMRGVKMGSGMFEEICTSMTTTVLKTVELLKMNLMVREFELFCSVMMNSVLTISRVDMTVDCPEKCALLCLFLRSAQSLEKIVIHIPEPSVPIVDICSSLVNAKNKLDICLHYDRRFGSLDARAILECGRIMWPRPCMDGFLSVVTRDYNWGTEARRTYEALKCVFFKGSRFRNDVRNTTLAMSSKSPLNNRTVSSDIWAMVFDCVISSYGSYSHKIHGVPVAISDRFRAYQRMGGF